MPKKILVASANPAFGELIRLSLEEGGAYRVRLVQNCEQALQLAVESDYDLAIMDCDLPGGQLSSLLQQFKKQRPNLRLILIPPDNNPNHPALSGVQAAAYLNKPFYLPDLLDTLERIWSMETAQAVESEEPEPVPPAPPPLPGLGDPAVAAASLAALMIDTNARCLALIHHGQLLATSGTLSDPAAVEVAQLAAKAWKTQSRGDLARYVRLEATGKDQLIVAHAIGPNLLLALSFDTSTPLSKARNQARSLAAALMSRASLPVEDQAPPAPPAGSQQPVIPPSGEWQPEEQILEQTRPVPISPADEQPEAALPIAEDALPYAVPSKNDPQPEPPAQQELQSQPEAIQETPPAPAIEEKPPHLTEAAQDVAPSSETESMPPAAPEPLLNSQALPEGAIVLDDEDLTPDEEDFLVEIPGFSLAELLAEMPSPDPEPIPQTPPPDPGHWVPEEKNYRIIEPEEAALPWEIKLPDESPRKPENGRKVKVQLEYFPSMEDTIPSTHLAETRRMDLNTAAETRRIGPEGADESRFLPMAAVMSRPVYTCILIPARPEHTLTGPLAPWLENSVMMLCRAFGWQLVSISVRPSHLQWSVSLPPAVSPGYLVRLVRRHVTSTLLEAFPHLRTTPRQDDFWAPGALIVSGGQAPTGRLLADFIHQTRRRQGIQPAPGQK